MDLARLEDICGTVDFILGGTVESIVRVDERGRITIPSDIRARVGLKSLARIRVEGDRIVIEPIKDPIERIESLVIDGPRDIEAEISSLRKAAEEELLKRFNERW